MILEPEMSCKIVDESHYHFHVTCKAKIIHAVNKLKEGVDFLKTLSRLNFTTDKRWTQNTHQDPNVAVLLGILDDYKRLEFRPSRMRIIAPLIEYAIGLYASDLFYRERGEWFMLQLLKRSNELRFYDCFCNPNNWYPKGRNDLYSLDTNINDDYKDWYNIDPEDENQLISYDMMRIREMIKHQKGE